MTYLTDTFYLLMRHLRTTLRLPIWIAVTLVQPVIWLTLFGQLFRRVVELPGFETTSYLQFMTPGVVIMTALFSAMWSGNSVIEDLDDGVIDRMLTTPVHRSTLITARVLQTALTVAIQSMIILGFGWLLGARFPGGAPGIATILLLAALLAAGVSALSCGLTLLTRRGETLVAVVQFFGMPLTFLSTAFMATALMPGWIRWLAQGNPVNWAITAARAAMFGEPGVEVWRNSILLLVFAVTAAYLATQAFQVYRRSI